MKRNSLVDHAALGVALIGQSAPTFFLGILFILVLSLKADLFPTSGRSDWRNLVLPALTLGAFAMASIARLTRSAVLEVLGADYIRTARAKGVSEMWVVAKHTFKNAAIPIVTITGLQFGTLLGGAVVTETVFSWPGIGRLAVQSIYNRDYPVVQCTVFIAALLFILINFAVDLVYGLLDPRIRAHCRAAVGGSGAAAHRWPAGAVAHDGGRGLRPARGGGGGRGSLARAGGSGSPGAAGTALAAHAGGRRWPRASVRYRSSGPRRAVAGDLRL